jgi:hypothetical protein
MKLQNATVSEGPIEAVGVIDGNNTTFVPPITVQGGQSIIPNDPLGLDIALYAPGGAVAKVMPAGKYHAFGPAPMDTDGGNFKNGDWSPNNGTLEGLYYVEGDVTLGHGVDIGPDGVTIVSKDGKIDVKGKQYEWKWYQHITDMTQDGVQYPAIIFFSTRLADQHGCGSNAIIVGTNQGNTVTAFHGVAYAPRDGFNMQGDYIKFNGSIVAYVIHQAGSTGVLEYDQYLFPARPPNLHVVE